MHPKWAPFSKIEFVSRTTRVTTFIVAAWCRRQSVPHVGVTPEGPPPPFPPNRARHLGQAIVVLTLYLNDRRLRENDNTKVGSPPRPRRPPAVHARPDRPAHPARRHPARPRHRHGHPAPLARSAPRRPRLALSCTSAPRGEEVGPSELGHHGEQPCGAILRAHRARSKATHARSE